jgi:hypothetical protein
MPAADLSTAPQRPSRKWDCDDPEGLQPRPTGPTGLGREAPATVLEALRSPGEPLDGATRAYFEPRFGQDFRRVRVHSGTSAEQSVRDINAHAYTSGQDMVFGAGRFAPQTSDGRRLLAHELAHVVQQTSPGRSHPAPVPRLQRKPRSGPEGTRDANVQVRWSEDEDTFYDRVVAALGRSPGFRGIDPADFNYASNTESTLHDLVRSFQNQYASFHHHHPKEGEPVKVHLRAHYNPSEDLLTDKQISFVEEPGAGKGTQPPAVPAQEAARSCVVAPKADEPPEQRAQRAADETACFIATYLVTLDKDNAAYVTVAVSPDSTFPSKFEREGTRDRQPDEGPLLFAKALTVVKAGIDLSNAPASQRPIAGEFVYSFGDRVHGPGLHLEKSKPFSASSRPAPPATPQGGEEFEDECNENDVDYAECLKLQYDENVKEMLKAGEEEFKAWYDPYGLSGGGGGGNINIPLPGRGLKLPKGARAATRLRKLNKLKGIVKSESMAMKELAGGIHGIRGRLKGQAIAVVEVRAGTEAPLYAAATNSGAGWRSAQTSLLKQLDIVQIPHTLSDTVHAEGNVRAWVENLRKTTGKDWKVKRWGMSAGYSGKYICSACREIVRQMGGIIEEF